MWLYKTTRPITILYTKGDCSNEWTRLCRSRLICRYFIKAAVTNNAESVLSQNPKVKLNRINGSRSSNKDPGNDIVYSIYYNRVKGTTPSTYIIKWTLPTWILQVKVYVTEDWLLKNESDLITDPMMPRGRIELVGPLIAVTKFICLCTYMYPKCVFSQLIRDDVKPKIQCGIYTYTDMSRGDRTLPLSPCKLRILYTYVHGISCACYKLVISFTGRNRRQLTT
jgi:hypothetical protein